jgi:hypothetical protein
MTSASATPNRYPYQNEPAWSSSEKAIARAAFDAALKRELHQGRVSEDELRGLAEGKLKSIRSRADFFAKYAD